MNKEEWRTIPESDHRYSVSSFGRVRGASGNILKPTFMKIGYLSVALSLGGGRVVRRYVHRLVADAFLGGVPDGQVVNHRNHDKCDNSVSNLELTDRRGNASHWAKKHRSSMAGRKRSGFCGRGHALDETRRYCLTCRRLSASGNYDNPPTDREWRQSMVPGYLISSDGQLWSKKTNRLIRGGVNVPGYQYFNLRVDGATKPYAAHRLVAAAFVGKLCEEAVVDHIDGNKNNNSVTNLRITSRSGNTSAFHDRRRKSLLHGYKLDHETVARIKAAFERDSETLQDIAERFGISVSHVRAIRTGRKWAHVRSCQTGDNS